MLYWTKYFIDGSHLDEFDQATKQQNSWSKTRLDGINRVTLCHNGKRAGLYKLGQYHQVDEYESSSATGQSVCVKRRIKRLMDDGSLDQGKWDTLEWDTRTNEVRRYITESKTK